MQESVQVPSRGSRCESRNRAGLPCRRLAVRGAYCTVHDPLRPQDMKALGAKGGRSKETALRKEVRVDDELRESARDVLKRALAGETVDKEALAAARSLFSYRSDVPTAREREHPAQGGPKVVSLVDVATVAIEAGMIASTCGCPVVVDGHPVARVDPTVATRESEPLPYEPPAPGKAPEDPSELVSDDAPAFDENLSAKLARRYGNDEGNYHW